MNVLYFLFTLNFLREYLDVCKVWMRPSAFYIGGKRLVALKIESGFSTCSDHIGLGESGQWGGRGHESFPIGWFPLILKRFAGTTLQSFWMKIDGLDVWLLKLSQNGKSGFAVVRPTIACSRRIPCFGRGNSFSDVDILWMIWNMSEGLCSALSPATWVNMKIYNWTVRSSESFLPCRVQALPLELWQIEL